MPSIATVLKAEISRLARKEVKAQTETLKKKSAQYRRDVAQLKRKVTDLERKVAFLEKKTWTEPVKAKKADVESGNVRYSAKGLASHRKKLGLSAADYAKLVGVSSLSIYKWEREETRPRDEQIAKLAAVRKIGKREAEKRLEQMG